MGRKDRREREENGFKVRYVCRFSDREIKEFFLEFMFFLCYFRVMGRKGG